MAWREITADDMLGVLNSLEAASYQAAAIGTGQDPLADATAAVVQQCRGYLADHPANNLAPGATLPERVILSAMHIIRVELLTRLDMEVSKDRASAKDAAIRFFERASEGKVCVEQPTTLDAVEINSVPSMQTLNSRDRIANRKTLSGL